MVSQVLFGRFYFVWFLLGGLFCLVALLWFEYIFCTQIFLSSQYSSIFSTPNIKNIFSTRYSSIFQHPNIENIFSTQIFKHFSTPNIENIFSTKCSSIFQHSNIENIFSTPSCGGASPVCPDGSALSTTGRRPCTGGR